MLLVWDPVEFSVAVESPLNPLGLERMDGPFGRRERCDYIDIVLSSQASFLSKTLSGENTRSL